MSTPDKHLFHFKARGLLAAMNFASDKTIHLQDPGHRIIYSTESPVGSPRYFLLHFDVKSTFLLYHERVPLIY